MYKTMLDSAATEVTFLTASYELDVDGDIRMSAQVLLKEGGEWAKFAAASGTSSESLVARYTKIADEEVTRTINSIPVPNVERRTHSRTHSAPQSLGKSGRLTADQAAGLRNAKSR